MYNEYQRKKAELSEYTIRVRVCPVLTKAVKGCEKLINQFKRFNAPQLLQFHEKRGSWETWDSFDYESFDYANP